MANWSYYPTRRYTGRRSFNPYYNTAYKNTRTRTSRRKANRESWAARQQKDASTVTISRIATVPVVIGNGESNGAVYINHWDQLRQSTYFPNYSPMYDQMKIDKIRIKITGNQSGSAVTANLSPAVVAAFDRNGLSPSQQITTASVSTYSSAQLKQWSTGNAFVMYQTIYPSTIMEKGQYIPTDSLQDPQTITSTVNPCVSESDPTLPFKPITLLGVDMGSSMSTSQTFAFTVEYEYTVTFRGMRKPSLAYLDYEVYGFRIYKRVGDIISPVLDVNIDQFLYAESNVTVNMASKSVLIRIYRRNYSLEGFNTVSVEFIFNPYNTNTQMTVQAGSYYCYVTPSFAGPTVDYVFFSPLIGSSFKDSDAIFMTYLNYTGSSVAISSIFVDGEDLPGTWWT
uniref:Capsid protein n=1 Tax=Cressdnaviricota sp. TaxID=2748378 RepID=A0A8E8D7W3_9VIRU|nr:capsid protein [Cressdnaviricota sp.]